MRSVLTATAKRLESSSITSSLVSIQTRSIALATQSNPDIKVVSVLGCGVIGASWAALFAHHGLKTQVYDPQPSAEKTLTSMLTEANKVFSQLYPSTNPSPSTSNITFTTDLATALKDTDLVQENGPERLEIKSALLKDIESHVRPDVLILTSTSGLTCSSMTPVLEYPARFAIGHPFNPPHLMPLVEIVGSPLTSPTTISTAMTFYTSLNKKPIHIKREVPGHIANRLQAALFREILYLIESDVATVSEIETAMEYGPGLRWGVMGPNALARLAGGKEGGSEHVSRHLMPPLVKGGWFAKEDPVWSEEVRRTWVEQTEVAVAGEGFEEMCERRDEGIIGILKRNK